MPDESWRRRFVAEARAASGLTHPGIVPVYDVFDDPKLPAIVFQFVEGESLADRLRRDGSVPLHDATRIAAQVAEALDHAHRAGLVHRDVKPANILLHGHDGRARLVDFGIARVVDDAQAELTGEHEVLGTLRYMAPEQLAGKASDARTDLYALGLVIAEMIPDLEAAPDWLRDLVGRLRAPDPADRPASAGDVARALETGDLDASDAAQGRRVLPGTADAAPPDAAPPDADAWDAPTVSLAALSAPAVAAPVPALSTPVPAAAEAVVTPVPATAEALEPIPPPAAPRPRGRVPARTDLRPVAIAIVVAGVILGGIALAGNNPDAGGGSAPGAAATQAPLLVPIPSNPGTSESPKPHGKGHGRGKG